ncbi:MAG: amidohydrolase [Smithellaceae bacterium]|nr:amidohydrolase [Smithellaceae bacterium]
MKIFQNGQFISLDEGNRVHSILIEEAGRIVFLGDAIPERYLHAPRIDLEGRAVIPAFVDTHLHFSSFAYFLCSPDVREAQSLSGLAEIIGRYEEAHPREKTTLGFGVAGHHLPNGEAPDRAALDRISSRPLMLVKYDGHAALCNSALLERLPGSVKSAPGYEGDSGWLYGLAFYDGVNFVTKSVSPVRLFQNFLAGADYLASKGIGLVHTAEGVGFPLDLDVDLMRFAARGLPLDFRVYFQTLDEKKVLKRNLPRIGGCFACALDGCFGSEDAALNEPYSNNPENSGCLFYSIEEIHDFVKKANRRELQIALHAIGDRAIEMAISAYEAALADYPRADHRHIIIHADLMTPALLARAARIGLHLAVQPAFLYWPQEPWEYMDKLLGERIKNLIPLRSMREHGLVIGGGSDAPCTLPDPFLGIYAACNHPHPDQRLSIPDALRLFTSWAARLSFDEKDRGTLEEGKRADLAVLTANPLTTPIEQLKDISVTDLYLRGNRHVKSAGTPLGLCFNSLFGRS